MHRRFSSRLSRDVRFFFQPVHLHLQLADLLVQPVLLGFPLRRFAVLATAEDFRQCFQRPLLPGVDLARVYPVW
jgi:hypothetical protein